MSGNIDMNGNGITNVATPVNDGDVVNKGYVDGFPGAIRSKLVIDQDWSLYNNELEFSKTIDLSGACGLLFVINCTFTMASNSSYCIIQFNNRQSMFQVRNEDSARTYQFTNLCIFWNFLAMDSYYGNPRLLTSLDVSGSSYVLPLTSTTSLSQNIPFNINCGGNGRFNGNLKVYTVSMNF